MTNTWRSFLLRSLFRAWMTFATLFILGWFLAAIIGGENLLHSDDSYLLGYIFGIMGASMAGVYCFIELLGMSRIRTTLLYLVLIGIWCAFLIILNLNVPDHDEGKGILLYIAFASGIIGIAAWPLCIVKISRIYAIVISVLSVLVSLLYLIVAFRMHNF
jgi:hypothetical protein